ESDVREIDGVWLNELSRHNTDLRSLNISVTNLKHVGLTDLSRLAANCRTLASLKLHGIDLEDLSEILKRTTALEELGGVSIGSSMDMEVGNNVKLPHTLTSLLALFYMGMDEGDDAINSKVQPIARRLRRLDLQYSCLTVDGHCRLLSQCANLQSLEVLNAVGDEGLEMIALSCKQLQYLRAERGDIDVQNGFVTQRGLMAVASNCNMLQYIGVYVSDINNAALSTIAANCPNLSDFRLVLLDDEKEASDYPLDNGIRDLMKGCPNLRRLALYLRHGFLTDRGLQDIGLYGRKLEWALFGLLGESDEGLKLFANGCPSLKKLEIRDCVYRSGHCRICLENGRSQVCMGSRI
ncbi:hypothetical protein KP509_16G043700, partial [Ceratopteris richardii]